nr:NADH-quinone oxidoreductase subunit N [Acidobacteriota bacterium]
LVQTRVKRMLAYSSIAHAGYLLLALMTPVAVSTSSIVFYLLSYTFMTVGAFAVVSLFQQDGEDADGISHFKGLVHRRPGLAWTMGLFLVSLIGIPPTGGFTGKYVIFLAALDAGHGALAALMGVTAVVGAAYYLRVIVAMFFEAPETEVSEGITVPVGTAIVLATAVAGTILLGVYPGLVLEPLSRVGTGLLAAIR